jgi:tetratricopeptide (TPR) repeat protein
MQHLAFIFKCAFALAPVIIGCVSGTTVDVNQTRQNMSPKEKKGLKISPPAGLEQEEVKVRERILSDLMREPSDSDDFNSEIRLPASALGIQESDLSEDPVLKSANARKMSRSDVEILANLGGSELEKNMGDVDRTLNLSEEQTEQLKPSYLSVTQRIRILFSNRKFEQALVETNELLLHYPNSALLWTMKGTLHLRLRNTDLSLASYEKAYEFEPSNQLKAQIEELRRIVSERENLRQRNSDSESQGQEPSRNGVTGLGGRK